MMSPYRETLARLEYNHSSHSLTTTTTTTPAPVFEYNGTSISNSSFGSGSSLLQNLTFEDFSAAETTHSPELPAVEVDVETIGEGEVKWNLFGQQNPSDLMNKLLNGTISQNSTYNYGTGNDSSQLLRESEESLPSSSLFPPAESSPQTESSDPTVILCALLIPIVIAIGGILIVALLIRRMRRAESKRELARENEENIFQNFQPRRHSVVFNPKHSFRLPVVLGLEPLDPNALTTPSPLASSTPDLNSTTSADDLSVNYYSNSNFSLMRATPTSTSTEKVQSSGGFAGRILYALNFPKRLREKKTEKNRFNIYTVSLETREQLKQIYVY